MALNKVLSYSTNSWIKLCWAVKYFIMKPILIEVCITVKTTTRTMFGLRGGTRGPEEK